MSSAISVDKYAVNKSPLYFLNQPRAIIQEYRVQFKTPQYTTNTRQISVSGSNCSGKFDYDKRLYKLQIPTTDINLSTILQPTTIYINEYKYTGSIVSYSGNTIYLNDPILNSKYSPAQLNNSQYTLFYLQNSVSQTNTYNYKSFIKVNTTYQLISGVLKYVNLYCRSSQNYNSDYLFVGNNKLNEINNTNYQFMLQMPK